METRAGQEFDETRIERDVRRLWSTGWFDDIRVESSESTTGVQLIFTLVERPRLYLRHVEFKPSRERLTLDLAKGEAVDRVSAKQAAAKLRRRLEEEGYADARVEAEIKPVGLRQADLRVRVERGRAYRVREVRLSGSLGLKSKELQQTLQSTGPQRLFPGLGRLWHGWYSLQPYSEARVQADVERLRSLYFSRGYFDARVEIGGVRFEHGKATITLDADSGRHYGLRHLEVAGNGPSKEILPQPGGIFKGLCRCLLEERRVAEKRGVLDFSAQLHLRQAPDQTFERLKTADEKLLGQRDNASPWVDITARITAGPAYRVGRIEFSGHRTISDATLRRALLLNEGDLFDQDRFRRSLERLSRFSSLKPVTKSSVRTELAPEEHRANLKIRVKENRGSWSVSGPSGPLGAFGPLQFTFRARLLPLSEGPVQLSTYNATLSLMAFPWPAAGLLTRTPRVSRQVFGALEQPYLPGQSWQSGFMLSPQLGWRETLAGYGLTHAIQGLKGTAAADPPGMSVPALWRANGTEDQVGFSAAGVLNCEERTPSSAWLRTAGSGAMSVAASWFLPVLLHF